MDISSEPDFAIICSFIVQFGHQFDIHLNIDHLEEWLLDQDKVDENLIDLHVKLIKNVRRYFVRDQWEKVLIRFAASYSYDDAVELETNGYLKTNPVSRLVLLRCLVDAQFDNGESEFKTIVNECEASDLRQQPIGRDLRGNTYWKNTDPQGNFRIYKEEPLREDSWLEICRLPNELEYLIEDLDKIKDEPTKPQSPSESEEIKIEPVIIRKLRTRGAKAKETNAENNDDTIILSPNPYDDQPCNFCNKSDEPELILLCDMCDEGCHTRCCIPPLYYVPDGDWFCRVCEHEMLLENLRKFSHTIMKLRTAYEIEMRRKRRKVIKREPMIKATPLKLCAPLGKSNGRSRTEDPLDYDGHENDNEEEEESANEDSKINAKSEYEGENLANVAMVMDDDDDEDDGQGNQDGDEDESHDGEEDERYHQRRNVCAKKRTRARKYNSSDESEIDELVAMHLKAKRKKEAKMKQRQLELEQLENLPSKRSSRTRVSYANLGKVDLDLGDEDEDDEALKSSDESLPSSDDSFKAPSEIDTEVDEEQTDVDEDDDDDATSEDGYLESDLEDELLSVSTPRGKWRKKSKSASKSKSRSKTKSKGSKRGRRKKRDTYSDDDEEDDEFETENETETETEGDDEFDQDEELSRSKRRAATNRVSYREDESDLDDELLAPDEDDEDEAEFGKGAGKGKSIENLLPKTSRKKTRTRSSDEESHESWQESPPKSDLGLDEGDAENESDKDKSEDTPTDLSEPELEENPKTDQTSPHKGSMTQNAPLEPIRELKPLTSVEVPQTVEPPSEDDTKSQVKSNDCNSKPPIKLASNEGKMDLNKADDPIGIRAKQNTNKKPAPSAAQSRPSPVKAAIASSNAISCLIPKPSNPMQALDSICAPSNTSFGSGMHQSLNHILNKSSSANGNEPMAIASGLPAQLGQPTPQAVVPKQQSPYSKAPPVNKIAMTQSHQYPLNSHHQQQYYPPAPMNAMPPHSNGHQPHYSSNNLYQHPYYPYPSGPLHPGMMPMSNPGFNPVPSSLAAPRPPPPSSAIVNSNAFGPYPGSKVPPAMPVLPSHPPGVATTHPMIPPASMQPNLTTLTNPNVMYNTNFMPISQAGPPMIRPSQPQPQPQLQSQAPAPRPPLVASQAPLPQQSPIQQHPSRESPLKHPPFYTEL